MKALQHARFGEPAEALELVELPELPLGPFDVTIHVEAAPVHAGDLKNIAGEKLMIRDVQSGDDLAVSLPQVPGIEGVGRIAACGASVDGLRVGDRVLLPWQCGSWRESLRADSRQLLRAPEGDATQLCLMVNAFTADFALRDLAPLSPGDWFVQNSANSNVGRALIKLARLRGIRTLNIVRRAELIPDLEALGADVVLVDGPDLARRVKDACGGAPLTIGLDGIGGAATGRLAECLSDGATVANFGSMSGEDVSIPTWVLLYKRVRVIGYYAGFNIATRSPQEQLKILGDLLELVATGQFQTKIAATYPLSRYRDAVAHAARSGADRDGKIIFVMDH